MNISKILDRSSLRRPLVASQRLAATQSSAKTGILLLNMGGPRSAGEVQEFLTRLFLDRDIIRLPLQHRLGPFIAKRRAPDIVKKYGEIGGGSPIYEWTRKQGAKQGEVLKPSLHLGDLMCQLLDNRLPASAPHRAYIGFRYARPLTEDTLQQMEADGIERVVAFSQYPQYSCTTAGSSMTAIYQYYANKKNSATKMRWSVIDRWCTHPKLIKTFADNIRKTLETFGDEVKQKKVVILFSAHSVPLYVMNRGDPYPAEVGATVQLVMQELGWSNPYRLVWQSKVGPLPWLKPDTEQTIKVLCKRGYKNLLLVPIAFVNEHIETLHELDIEYALEVGSAAGAERVARCPTPNDHPLFVEAMADLVEQSLTQKVPAVSPQLLLRCPMCDNANCSKTKAWLSKIKLE